MTDTTRFNRGLFRVMVCVGAALVLVAAQTAQAAEMYGYVTNGLVAWFDGIENAGFGVHDETSRIWKNLVAGGADGTLDANIGWTANGWVNNANGRPVALGTSISSVIALRNFTLEFVCRPSRATSRWWCRRSSCRLD